MAEEEKLEDGDIELATPSGGAASSWLSGVIIH
jgi:hypothetical protein